MHPAWCPLLPTTLYTLLLVFDKPSTFIPFYTLHSLGKADEFMRGQQVPLHRFLACQNRVGTLVDMYATNVQPFLAASSFARDMEGNGQEAHLYGCRSVLAFFTPGKG